MEKNNDTNFVDTIINGLKKATVELEEFRVQVALGKAEARDAYEDAKKKFNTVLHEAEQKLAKTKAQDALNELKALFETLMVQLALGKAETREAFEEQRKKITNALTRLEHFLETNSFTADVYETLHREIQKFRIKLDILKLRFELNKMEAQDEFETRKKDFIKKLEVIEQKLRDKEKSAEQSWEHLREDISEAYQHVKKVFS